MGIAVPLAPLFRLTYRAECGDGLVEHEIDHVFTGAFEGAPLPDPAEVSEWRWIAPDALDAEIALAPETFTVWFRLLIPQVRRLRG